MNQRTVLVKVDSVMALTGKDSDTVFAQADGAALFERGFQWVWNVAADPAGQMRDLRFWVREVIAPETTERLELGEVLDTILATKRTLHAGELCFIFQVRRQSLMRLRAELSGEPGVNTTFFKRAAVADFLRRRWLGAHGVTRPVNQTNQAEAVR